jgi:hypothetical protein
MDRLDRTSPKRARKDMADGPQQPPKRRRALGIMPLEPRIMYDGAAAATAAAASAQPHDAPAADAGRNTGPAPQDSANAPAERPSGVPTDHTSALQAPTINAPASSSGASPSATPTLSDASDTGSAANTPATLHEIVFIDGSVPDLQDLVSGAKPGETVVVLDPTKDGVQQMADYLAANDVHGLAAIQIVSHGLEGEVRLGNTTLTDSNLADHTNALAEIGAALAPGGDILLYGCYVGHGDAGQQFLLDLTTYTGANIAASTAPVGTTTDGINWNLDVSTGPIEAAVPFTAAALADFQGELAVGPTGQLFFRINQGNDVQLGAINNTGVAATHQSIYFGGGITSGTPQNVGVFNGNETSVTVDTAAGLVFSVGIGNHGSYDAFSVHNLKTGALIETIEFGPNTGSAATDDIVQALALNPVTHTLYVGDWGTTTATTGVAEFTYDPATGLVTPIATGTSGTSITTTIAGGSSTTATDNGIYLFTEAQVPGYTDANAFYLDSANNKLYYVNDDSGYNIAPFSPTNGVYVVNTNGPTFTATQLTSSVQFPTANQSLTGHDQFIGPNGSIVGVAVDVADGVVFFETTDTQGSANNALWWVNATGANQTATKIALPASVTLNFAGQSNEGGDAAGLTFDASTKQLYLTNADNSATTPDKGAIYQLQYTPASHTVSLINTYDTAKLVGATPATVNSFDAPSTTTFDILPVLTITGTTAHATEQGAFIDLTTSNGSTDQDGAFYASATVQITGGTFSSNETSANDDHLAVLDGGVDKTSGKFGATNITIAYDAANEKLTLTGYDSIANYNAALAAVEYKTTGDNPTNYGANTTRTISWTVSDGALNIPFGAQNSGTTTLNIDAVNDAPVNHLPASPSLNEDVQTAITGISITDVDANPASQNITVTLSVQHGTLNVLTNVANGITAPEITAGAQDSNSITITATQNQINATLGANGLRYLSDLNYNGPETLHIVTSDNGNTGSGGAQGDTDDLSITVNPVNDPPNLQPDTTTAVAYTENAAPTALFAGESINSPSADVDNSANYAGGSLTLSVTGGAVLGDRIALLASSGFTISAGNLLDAGSNVIGAISGNGSGTVTVSALTALATPTVVNQLTQAFGFQNTTDDPGAGDRTITETFNDGGNTGSGGAKTDSVTQIVHVTPVNDAPVLSATATNPTFTEAAGVGTQAAAVSVFSGANANTIEAGQSIAELDFTVSGLQDGANEKIVVDGTTIALGASSSGTTATNGMAYTVTVLGGNASIALTKAAGVSVANIDTLVNGITYQDTNTDNPTAGGRVFTLTSIKDTGGTANSGVDTTALAVASTVTVVPTNDAPVLAGAGNTDTYTEQASAILVDSGITLSDVDSPNLTGATVTISSGLQAGDTLHFTDQNGITGAYSGGVLTLTGSATVAQYQAALASVTFDNQTNDNPTNGLASLNRTVTWQVNDGGAANNVSNTGTSTITVTPVNDAPTALATAGFNATEQVTLDLKNGGLSVSDVDGAGGSETATLSVLEGTLTVTAGTSGATVSGSGTPTVTINGTTAQINALLNTDASSTVRYTDSSNTPAASTTLTLAINDNGHTGAGGPLSGSAATQIVITAVDDAPVLTNVGPTASSTEQVFAVLDNNATASDVELNALNGGNGDYSGASLTIARHLGANAQDAFAFSAAGATFTVSGNALQAGGQTFATFASVGGVLTIDFTSSGTPATTALVNNVMQHVTYANQSDAPPASVTLDYTFSDGNTGAQGTGGAQTATGSTIVSITAVNDAPVNTVPGAQSTAENNNLVFSGPTAISISDADSGGLNETVTLSVLNGTLSLGSTAGLASFTNNAATVTMTGTLAAINADLNGLTYHPGLNFVGSDTLTVVTNDNGHTGTGGALTDSDSVAISVTSAATATLDGQLFYLISNGPDSQAAHVNSDGSNATTFYANNSESTIAVDTAAGLIFTTNAANGAFEDTITVHSATTGAVIGTPLVLGPGGGNDIVTALTIDPYTHTLYVGDWGNDASTTGVKTISYDPLTGALTDNGFLFTAAQTQSDPNDVTTIQFTNAQALYYDHANHLLYYAENDAGFSGGDFHATNGIYVVSTAAGSTFQPTELTSELQFPTDNSSGFIDGLTVDVADGIVYFLTTDTTGSLNNALWAVNTNDPNQTATQITMPAGTTLTDAGQVSGEPGGLSFDAQTRQLYVSNQEHTAGGTKDLSFVAQLQVDAIDPHVVTLVHKFDVASLVGATPTTVDSLDTAAATSFDILPVFTVNGTTTHVAEQGGFVDLTTTNGSTDQDGDHYAGATVQITGGTFASNETSAADDHLAVLDGGVDKTSGTFTGTNISFTYDSATEKLTLSGYDTITNYNTVLAAVEYKTTGDNPTNSGLNTTRTIHWTVSDGAQNIPFGAQNSGTTTLTIDAVNDAPVNHVPAAQSVLEDTSLAITGVSVTDVDANPASDVVQVTLGVAHGTLTVATNVLTGPGAITGNGTGSVVLSGTLNAINATLAEANGLAYQGNLNFNGSDTLTVTTNDQGHTGTPGALQDVDTVAINVISVNDAPAGADNTVSTALNTAHVFTAGEFGFSDPNDTPANALQAVKITTTPAAGSLTDNGVTVAAGQFVSVADINAGKLVFTPANGGSGADYADFTFQVQDNGGTANGGVNLDPTPNKMTIDVSAKTVSITGTAQEGQTLTANPSGDPGATFTYQWQSSSDNGATFQNIATNSTNQTYVLTEADEFKLIRVETTFIDGGSTIVDSAPTTLVADSADAVVTISGLTGGNAVEGTQVSVTAVTDSSAAATATGYQWLRDGNPIGGATGSTYTPTELDEGHALTVNVSFTDANGNSETGTGLAGTVQEIAGGDTVVTLGGLTAGNAVEGTPVVATVTDGTGNEPVSNAIYTWRDNGAIVQQGSSNSYTPLESDEGHALTLDVTFTDVAGNTESAIGTSAGTVQEIAGGDTTVTLSGLIGGNAVEGLPVIVVTVTDGGSFVPPSSYQWLRDGNPIGGANLAVYTPVEADEGHVLTVSVGFADPNGNPETGTGTAGTVQETLGGDTTVSFSGLTGGNAVEGTPVVATVTDGTGNEPVTNAIYTWRDNGAIVQQGSSNSYTPVETDEGHALTLDVTFTDVAGNTETQIGSSAGIVQEVAGDDTVVTLGGLTGGNAVEGTAVTATITDGGQPVGFAIYTWISNSNIVQTGASNSYTPLESDEGHALSVDVVFADINGNGEGKTGTSAGIVQEIAGGDSTVTISGLSGGNAVEGTPVSVTSATDGGLAVAPSSFQWLRDGTAISGATNASYTPVEADEGHALTVAVGFTDPNGNVETGSGTAGTVQEVAGGDTTVTFSGLTGGNAVEGTAVVATVTDGTANEPITSAIYTWRDNGAIVQQGSSNSYTPTELDEGHALTLDVTFTDVAGNTETQIGTSAGTVQEVVGGDTVVTLGGLTAGNAVEGTPVTAIAVTDGGLPVSPSSFQWLRDGNPIGGANFASYTPIEADEGHALTVSVGFADPNGNVETGTGTAGTVQEITPDDTVVTISGLTGGNATEGTQVGASITDGGLAVSGASYQWLRDGNVIAGATNSTYTPGELDEGHALTVSVSFADAANNPETGTGTAGTVQEIAGGDTVVTISGLTGGNAVEGTQVSAAITDGGLAVTGAIYQWRLDGNAIAGATASTYTPGETDETHALSVTVSFTDAAGNVETGGGIAGTVQDIVPTVTTPTITGIAQEGQILTSSVATTNDSDAVVHYQWEKSTDGFATFTLVGSDSKTYAVTEADEGFAIRVVATTSDADNSAHATAASAATAAVIDIDPTITAPTIVVTPQQGPTAILTAVGAVTNDSDAVIHYQWLETHGNGPATVIGTDSPIYVTQPGDQGGTIQVRVFTTDADNGSASASAFSTNSVHGNDIVAPPTHDNDPGHGQGNGNDDHGGHGNSFGMVTNVQGNGGFPGFSGLGFTPGNAVYAIRADIDPTIGLDGKIDFKLPLLALEAPLGGDIVSVTATLADGRPLPSWLHFDGNSGQFAGLVPDDILTGSLPPTAGGVPGGGAGTGAMAVPDTITIEVVARNAKGDISILDFTLDLTGKNPVKTGRHGWNLPNSRTFDPWTIERQRGGLAAHRDVAIPASWDGASDALPHGRGHDADRPAGHHVPAGRAGLTAQLATLGTRGIDAGRTALLDSLRDARR